MSMNSPSILRIANLSSGILACRYAPGTSNIAVSRSSCALTRSIHMSASKDRVGGDASSHGTKKNAHVRPFILPQRLSLMSFTALSALRFWSCWSNSGFSLPSTFKSSSCLYSLNIAATALAPYSLIPLLAVI
jgi:hypothetical protein